MRITTPIEGQLYQLALAHLCAQNLVTVVSACLARPVKRRAVDTVGYLRVEWLGAEALAAVQEGYQRAGKRRWGSTRDKVAVSLGEKSRLYQALLQAIPIEVLPAEFIELRLALDVSV
ncbi:hypothetical protein [Pseudomonas sp. Irchel s3a12]|uniref:hypothetical protein n=1 Tax=Pseudomonas sp. Irchel s3a12 TaxID=2009047 RepID=UPI000BA3DDCE|nr:hypothetical protein [Pseudomonas sp. Irchel s3a12]